MNKSYFSELELNPQILKAVTESGYTEPTPIQQKSIPILLKGHDLLGCAQTGTGKTAAFALPMLNHLYQNRRRMRSGEVRSLILTPTRELAVQIFDNFKDYGKYLGLHYSVVFGGVGQGNQVKSLERGADVLIATPGRLLDLMEQKYISLQNIEIFVLDEADRMLDMGFINDIKKVLPKLPPKRQNLFFSATMPKEIQTLAKTILKDPQVVEVAPVSSTAELIEQKLFYVEKSHKRNLLLHLLKDNNLFKVIVFTRTKHGARRVSELLEKNRILSDSIHGDKSQNARQRALENFKKSKIRVLVATDIAARGIDVDEVTHVINFEIPNIAESYVHRIGRTARAGHSGIAYSFCDSEELAFVRDIEKITKQTIPVDTDHPYHSEAVANSRPLSKGKAKALIEQKEQREGSHKRNPHFKKKRGSHGRPQPRKGVEKV